MLQDLQIKGFKGLRNLQLTDISRVTLVGGKNNVGKTSLLESICYFYDAINPNVESRGLVWRGTNNSPINVELLFPPIFTQFNTDTIISFEVKDSAYVGKMHSRFKAGNKDNFKNPFPPLKTNVVPSISASYEVFSGGQRHTGNVNVLLKETPANLITYFERDPTTTLPSEVVRNAIFFPLRAKKDFTQDTKRFSNLDSVTIDRVVSFLQEIEPQLIGLTLMKLDQELALFADIQGWDRKVPIGSFGDGMSKLLSIILSIATANNGIVLIDEIDAGIHHSVLPKVWEGIFKAAKDFNGQIIATTHSYECLQAAYEGSSEAHTEDDFSYIRLERFENDIIGENYSHAVLGAALEHGWEVR